MRLNPQKMKKITVVLKERLVNKLNDVCDETEDINRSELIQQFCEYGLDNIDEILPEYENDEEEDQDDDDNQDDYNEEDDNDQDDDEEQDDYDDNEDDDQEDNDSQDDCDDTQDDDD